jgi:hypothetical protein
MACGAISPPSILYEIVIMKPFDTWVVFMINMHVKETAQLSKCNRYTLLSILWYKHVFLNTDYQNNQSNMMPWGSKKSSISEICDFSAKIEFGLTTLNNWRTISTFNVWLAMSATNLIYSRQICSIKVILFIGYGFTL